MRDFFKKLDKKYLKVACYASIAVLVTFFVGLGLYQLGPSVAIGLKMVHAILSPLILGLVLCYLLYPIVNWLDKGMQKLFRTKKSMRKLSVFLVILFLLAAVALILVLLVSVITKQISRINFSTIVNLIEMLLADYENLMTKISDWLSKAGINVSSITNVTKSVLTGLAGNITSFGSTLLFGIIFSIYFLVDGLNISRYWRETANKLFSKKTITSLKSFGKDADACFSGYIRGQMLDALIVGLVATLALTIAGMPYGALIGILTGVGNMIPYVGPIFGYGSIIVINVLNWNPKMLLIGLIIVIIIMFIDGNIINPRLLAGSVHVHPLLVVASLLAGGAIGGLIGMVVAVPCGALIKLRFDKWVDEKAAADAEEERERVASKADSKDGESKANGDADGAEDTENAEVARKADDNAENTEGTRKADRSKTNSQKSLVKKVPGKNYPKSKKKRKK